uniref:Uncharacterized protein n=1 Tax=Anguilla anguilla TaxID=7936 RepID=A0A0E9R2H9_ANGAN
MSNVSTALLPINRVGKCHVLLSGGNHEGTENSETAQRPR